MEAKDTIIKDKQSELIQCPNCQSQFVILYHNIREEQAEISYRVGYQQALNEHEWGKQAGIKEVAEWVKQHTYESGFIWQEGWQAKLKEWRVE